METQQVLYKIYKITDENETKEYIGYTKCSIDYALKRHIKNYNDYINGKFKEKYKDSFNFLKEFGTKNCKIIILEEVLLNIEEEEYDFILENCKDKYRKEEKRLFNYNAPPIKLSKKELKKTSNKRRK